MRANLWKTACRGHGDAEDTTGAGPVDATRRRRAHGVGRAPDAEPRAGRRRRHRQGRWRLSPAARGADAGYPRRPARDPLGAARPGQAHRQAREEAGAEEDEVSGRRVLITGVSTRLGTGLARRLERDPGVEYVAGLDVRPPRARLERTEFMDADIRNPVIGKLIPQTEVDTVVHNQIVRQPGGGVAPRAMHDINVIGTLQLLAACEQTQTIRSVVVRGSAGIYGAEPAAPQFYTEEMARLYPLRTRFQRDVGEIENYFEGYSRRHPEVVCTMLRYQPSIGPGTDSQVTRYLSAPVVPSYLGFDPRLQFVHETDGLESLLAAIRNPD